MRQVNYYYKQSSLEYKDNKDKLAFEISNEYGYNFGSENKINIDDEFFLKPKNIVNKDFLNLKR